MYTFFYLFHLLNLSTSFLDILIFYLFLPTYIWKEGSGRKDEEVTVCVQLAAENIQTEEYRFVNRSTQNLLINAEIGPVLMQNSAQH